MRPHKVFAISFNCSTDVLTIVHTAKHPVETLDLAKLFDPSISMLYISFPDRTNYRAAVTRFDDRVHLDFEKDFLADSGVDSDLATKVIDYYAKNIAAFSGIIKTGRYVLAVDFGNKKILSVEYWERQ